MKKKMVDPIKQIKEATDVIFLTQLDKYVDMDIANLDKQSDFVIEMKEEMFRKPIETINKESLEYFNKMKKAIKERIEELNKGS